MSKIQINMATVLSLFAIAISLIGLYFNEFRVSQNLEIAPISIVIENNSIKYKLAIINSGNKKTLITNSVLRRIENGTVKDFKSSAAVYKGNGVLSAAAATMNKSIEKTKLPFSKILPTRQLPFSVDPNSIEPLVISGTYPLEYIFENAQNLGFEIIKHDQKEAISTELSLYIESMDFNGNIYEATAGTMSLMFTSDGVITWAHHSTKRSLFQRKEMKMVE